MTLRLRLVIALMVLLVAGLSLFGFATYSLYAHSQYQRLDDQVRSSLRPLGGRLLAAAGISDFDNRNGGFPPPGAPTGNGGNGTGGNGTGGNGNGPGPQVAAYGELRDASGALVTSLQLSAGTAKPKLPVTLRATDPHGRLFNASATSGSGQFRVFVGVLDERPEYTVVVAVPMTEVTNSLHRLVLTEVVGGAVLLVVLSAGSWLVLRRGLRPLEQMAGTARSITSGDLSQRVSPAGGPTEVGQLGLALNTMLDDIEAGFREREATEQRLRQFLADASHELRTPLTSIQGFAELFRVSGDNARVDLPTILRRIEEESGRMKGLVEDLLLLARLDQPRVTDRVPVDLAVIAADACSDAVAVAPDRAVTLDAPQPVVVAGDQDHLRQAVANLVTNALRHTPPATPIEVSARVDDGQAVVVVRDHGPGLDDEALAHVFDRFWQADRARVGRGAGLGLAIVAGIAAEHGGRVDAANAPAGGAIFTLTLPLSGAAAVQVA